MKMFQVKTKLFFHSFLYFLLIHNICFAQQGEWITGVGERLVENITYEQAKIEAINEARKNALQKKNLNVQDFISIFQTSESDRTHAFQMTNVIATAYIIDAKEPYIISDELVSVGNRNVRKLTVGVEICVRENKGEPDPNFQLEVALNKDYFKDKDEIILKVKSTLNAYLTIINLAPDGKAYFILPSKFRDMSLIEANKWIEIPNEDERKNKGITLYAYLPENMDKSSEIIMIIATKIPNKVIPIPEKIDKFVSMPWEEMTRKLMGGWLASVPMDQKIEAFIQYNITK